MGALSMLTLDAKKTALVLIDVQKGTLGFNLSPHAPAAIIATSAKLAQHWTTSRTI